MSMALDMAPWLRPRNALVLLRHLERRQCSALMALQWYLYEFSSPTLQVLRPRAPSRTIQEPRAMISGSAERFAFRQT